MPARPTREGRSMASAVTGRLCGEPPHNTLPGWQQRCSLPAGAHLMQAGAGEVELREGGPVVIRHIRPAAEEDQGVGVADQRPHVHFDVGLLLGRRMVTGIPARAGRKSPSQSFLESWAPPAHGSASCKSLGGGILQTFDIPTVGLCIPPFPALADAPSTYAVPGPRLGPRQMLHDILPQHTRRVMGRTDADSCRTGQWG